MSHCQIFYPFDNEDGYISVVCHRERFLDGLLSLGWQKTADEAIAYGAGKKGPDPVEFVIGSPDLGLDISKEEVEEVSASIAGLSNKQRKKLSLKK